VTRGLRQVALTIKYSVAPVIAWSAASCCTGLSSRTRLTHKTLRWAWWGTLSCQPKDPPVSLKTERTGLEGAWNGDLRKSARHAE